MTKVGVVLPLALVALAAATGVALAGPATGAARLHPIDQSGIEARINFVDTGTALQVSGTATGMDPTKMYFSLIYDNGSVPGGPHACEPTGGLTGPQMVIGFWQPLTGSSTRSLTAVKTGPAYAPLSAFDTVSVRVVLGPPPAGFVLQACGEVHTNP